MPIYTFLNANTNEIEEHEMRISELDQFKSDNPHLSQKISGFSVVASVETTGKLPEGFKDRLREIKKAHPGGGGITQV